MRLLITVLLLIVLPTALLSVLAGRSIQERELILDRRLAQEAVMRLDEVAGQADRRVGQTLTGVMRLFRETLLTGENVRRFDDKQLAAALPPNMIDQVFLYMNPWGYVYPEIKEGGSDATSAAALQLQPALTEVLASGRSRQQGRIVLTVENRLFCFEPLPDYNDLYVGIELNVPEWMRFLDRLVATQTRPEWRFSIVASDFPALPLEEHEESVLISDNLGTRTNPVADLSRPSGWHAGMLASRRLQPPLGHIEMGVSVANDADMRQAFILRERLTVWGIILLAVVIISSAVMVIAGALRQVDTARRRSELMAGMSHDLRTPVAAMRMLAESLLAGRVVDDAKRHEFLEVIVAECDRLGDLIERVMFYFRQERGASSYKKAFVDVDELVSGVAERFRRQHAGRVRISVVPAPESGVYVNFDALEKALTNLIDNAVKYGHRTVAAGVPSAESGDAIEIEVRATVRRWRGRAWTVLAVRDWGNGLAPGEQRRVFRRFYRGRSSAHAHRGGFGLGLSLVADIIKAHRGRFLAHNAPDGGAIFELWLRRKAVRRE